MDIYFAATVNLSQIRLEIQMTVPKSAVKCYAGKAVHNAITLCKFRLTDYLTDVRNVVVLLYC